MTQRSSILYWEEEEEERRGQVGEGGRGAVVYSAA